MCDCPVCLDARHFRAELVKLPADKQPVFETLHDILLDSDMEADYAKAVIEGSWPDADKTLASFREHPATVLHAASEPSTEMLEHLDALPSEAQPYFRQFVQRLVASGMERVRLKNIMHHAVPDAAALIAQSRTSGASGASGALAAV